MTKGLAVIYDRASSKQQELNYTRQDVKRIGFQIAEQYGYEHESEPRFEVRSGEELRNREIILTILNEIQTGKTKDGRRITAIIVPNFTRLSRDEDIIDGLVIKKICRDFGVVVIDFNGKVYNFENDNDQDAAFLELWFGARDKRQILSNTMRGLKERALQGKFMGGFAPLGYRLVPTGEVNRRGRVLHKLVIDTEESKLVRKIFALIQNHSARETTVILNKDGSQFPVRNKRRLKVHGQSGRSFNTLDILRIVTNPIYAGWICWNQRKCSYRSHSRYLKDLPPQMHFDSTLQILSQDEFNRVQRIVQERKKLAPRTISTSYPFSQILKCVNCGGGVVGEKKLVRNEPKPRYRHYYRCKTAADSPHQCPKPQMISELFVAGAIIACVGDILGNGEPLIQVLHQAAKEFAKGNTLEQLEAETKAELEKTAQSITRVTDFIAEGVLQKDEARIKLQELREKKDRLTQDLQGFQEKENIRQEILEAVAMINDDLARVLWQMLEKKPRTLGRVVRLIFKPRSVSVVSEWNKNWNLIGESSIREFTNERKTAKVIQFELQDEFSQIVEAIGWSADKMDTTSKNNEGDETGSGGVSELLAARQENARRIETHSRSN